ncbi:unnamed protein product [Lota lota]
MNLSKAGLSLRTIVLTPEKIPRFLIPSPARSTPLLLRSPRRASADRSRLLSCDSTGSSPDVSPGQRHRTRSTSRFFGLPTSGLGARIQRRCSGEADAAVAADTDISTRAAMSLPHVKKVTTPYGFRAVLASSPCCRRRESLFHHKRVTPAVVVTDSPCLEESSEARGQLSGLSARVAAAKARGFQVMKALTPARRRVEHR